MAQYTRYTSEHCDPRRGPQASSAAPKRRRWPKVLRYVGLVLVAAVCVSGGMFWGWLQNTAAQLQKNDPIAVKNVEPYIHPTKDGQPVNILLIGSDRRADPRDAGDKGRSDTMLLVRLDPQARTVSMLSVPRDLYVDIPGAGKDRVNVAYTVGGDALTVRMFEQLTGLPINHFIDINFVGFVNIVDKLGGIFVDVDRRYYNPMGTGHMDIDLQPGYQRLNGHQAIRFVRFRSDAKGDFNRMVRQQIFLHEVERQAKRWSVGQLPGLIKALTSNTVSDIKLGTPFDSGTNTLFGLAKTMLGLNTSRVYQAHITGIPFTTSGGAEVLQADPVEIKQAVTDFTDPKQAPIRHRADKIAIGNFPVRVLNGSGKAGVADAVATALRTEGYKAHAAGNADSFQYAGSVVYAPADLQGYADAISSIIHPAVIRNLQRLPGTLDGITVIVGSSYAPQSGGSGGSGTGTGGAVQQQIVSNTRQDLSRWQTLAASAKGVTVMMPTVWSTGMVYDANLDSYDDSSNFRAYTIASGHGNRAAVCVVGATTNQGYWHIEETTWTDPPMLSDPNDVRTINGRGYMLFYQGQNLHRVAFKANGCLYWVTNSLDDQLSNQLMLALATSMVPVN
jgi:LCP family protein required for cell wall assembly